MLNTELLLQQKNSAQKFENPQTTHKKFHLIKLLKKNDGPNFFYLGIRRHVIEHT